MANKSRVRRSARSKGALVWTTILVERQALATTGTLAFDIVADTDWTTVGGKEKATVVRVRGWMDISVEPAAVLTASGPVFAFIGTSDEDEAAVSASVAGTYKDEDIMATYGHQFPYSNISQPSPDTWKTLVDIKAMRKIQTGQELRLTITNEHTLSVTISMTLRALLKRG